MDESIKIVYSTLYNVISSQDDNLIKESTTKIVEFRTKPGFSEVLYAIMVDAQSHHNVRQLACVELKNTIHTHWNDMAEGYIISTDEKERIRNLLFNSLSTVSLKETAEIAIAISHFVKYDYPRYDEWIFRKIINAANEAPENSEYLAKLLIVLDSCVHLICHLTKLKEYDEYDPSSQIVELYTEKRNFFKKNDVFYLLNALSAIWERACQSILQSIENFRNSNGSGEMLNPIMAQIEITSFKIIKNILVTHGAFIKVQDANPLVIVKNILDKLQVLTNFGKVLPYNDLSKYLYKMVKHKSKFLIEFQEKYPFSFVPVLEQSLSMFLNEYQNWQEIWRNDPFFENILISSMTFIANVISCNEYTDRIEDTLKYYKFKNRGDIDMYDEKAILSSKNVLQKLISDSYLTFLLHTLISKYIKLSDDAIETWDQDPEEFINEELSEAYQTKIPACADILFYRIMGFNRALVSKEVMSLTKSTYDICNRSPDQVHTNEILLKDACYASLVLGYNTLSEELAFSDIYALICKDLEIDDPRYKIIRKRIAMIISQWVMDIPQEMHKEVFSLLVYLMNDKDIVVRFHTAVAVNNLLSEIDFDYEPYSEQIKPTVYFIIALSNDMQESNTTRHVLELVSKLITYLRGRITPYVETIIQSLSDLWVVCQQKNKNLLKPSIIGILNSLTESLKDIRSVWSILNQMCTYSIDLNNPESIFLLEDGLRLWYSMVQQSDSWNDDLNAMYPHLKTIYEKHKSDYNVIPLIIRLIEAHIFVGQLPLLNIHGLELVQMLERLVTTRKLSLQTQVYDLLSNFIQMFPTEAPPVLRKALQISFKNLKITKKSDAIISCCTLFMNLAAFNKDCFFALFSGETVPDLDICLQLEECLELLLNNFRLLSYIQPEKLWIAGFSNILANISQRLPQYNHRLIDAIVTLILTVEEQEQSSRSRRYNKLRDVVMIKGSPAETVRRVLKDKSPEYYRLSDIENYFLEKMKEVSSLIGNQLFTQTQQCETQTRQYLMDKFKA